MKHTFIFIDKLLILLQYVPRSLDTEEDKTRARNTIILIKEYAHTLKNLLINHKNKKYLDRLHKTHIDKIDNWAEQVTAVFRKMDTLLTTLEEDVEKLAATIEDEPEKWQQTLAEDVARDMIMSGLHDEEEDMKRLRNIAIFEIHELEEIISHQKHVAELLEWERLTKLSEEEQFIEYEKHFVRLLK